MTALPLRPIVLLLGLYAFGLAPVATAQMLDSLVEIGSIDTPGLARGVSAVGTRAYVADLASGLRVIDVSNPALPVELGFLDTPDNAIGVSVVGTLAYLADGASGLRVIDVS